MNDRVESAEMPVAEAARLMRWASYASLSLALFLIAVKFAAWLLTDSVSLLSTLVDSLLDAAASLVSLLAVRHALTPPDREHRFGHGKAEPLAALAQSTFIAGSAIFILVEAAEFVAWLEANEQAFADAHPEGSEYMGTYFNVIGGTTSAGSVYTLVGMDSYATMDALAAAGGECSRLLF